MKPAESAIKILSFLVLFVLFVVLVVPFFIPIPPLENQVDAKTLADADSLFVDVDGISIHYKQMNGSRSDLILLHGLGASVFSWHRVMEPLSALGTVTAYDRPAFGLTERILPGEFEGRNPYTRAYQPELLEAFMRELDIDSAVLIGNSAGGTVAAQMALKFPERVEALVLVDPALLTLGGPPSFFNNLFRLPSIDRIGPLFVRWLSGRAEGFLERAFHDPSVITEAMLEGYKKPFQVKNWDVAFWEFLKATEKIDLVERLDEIDVPVLIITGDDDRIIPTEESIRAAGMIPNAELVVIPNCGHAPQEECPIDFLDAVEDFQSDLEMAKNNG